MSKLDINLPNLKAFFDKKRQISILTKNEKIKILLKKNNIDKVYYKNNEDLKFNLLKKSKFKVKIIGKKYFKRKVSDEEKKESNWRTDNIDGLRPLKKIRFKIKKL